MARILRKQRKYTLLSSHFMTVYFIFIMYVVCVMCTYVALQCLCQRTTLGVSTHLPACLSQGLFVVCAAGDTAVLH